MKWPILPLITQGLLIAVDEFYFHFKRRLTSWERIGHPIDTSVFLVCSLIALVPGSLEGRFPLFLGFSILSCLIITKDEWTHRDTCSGAEMWIHALLFILHPVVLYSIWQLRKDGMFQVLRIQTALIGGYLVFQILYWNRKTPELNPKGIPACVSR